MNEFKLHVHTVLSIVWMEVKCECIVFTERTCESEPDVWMEVKCEYIVFTERPCECESDVCEPDVWMWTWSMCECEQWMGKSDFVIKLKCHEQKPMQ